MKQPLDLSKTKNFTELKSIFLAYIIVQSAVILGH